MSCPSIVLRSLLLAAGLAAAASTPAAPRVEDSIAQRAQACTVCHGQQGRASSAGYLPRIAGKPAGYLYHQLLNFRDGRRHYALMVSLVDPLSDDYLREIAGYFASLDLPYPPPQAPTAAAEVLAHGKQLVTSGDAERRIPACVQCHGSALTGVGPAIPGLLGVPRDYINSQLGAWQTGKRRAQAPDCMAQVAKLLTPEDIGALSQWLAAQPVPEYAKPAAMPARALPIACGGVAAAGAAR
jgi:cytochrome c553